MLFALLPSNCLIFVLEEFALSLHGLWVVMRFPPWGLNEAEGFYRIGMLGLYDCIGKVNMLIFCIDGVFAEIFIKITFKC